MIDFEFDNNVIVTPTCIEPDTTGLGTKVTLLRQGDIESRGFSFRTLPIRTSALKAAMYEAMKNGEPWLCVKASDIPALNAKYDPSRPQEPAVKSGRFLGFGGS